MQARGDFIGGAFVSTTEEAADAVITRKSPRDLDHVVARACVRLAAVDEAVASARSAFPAWSRAEQSVRTALVLKLKNVIDTKKGAFAETIAREVGKPIWEARTEVAAAISKIDVTLNDGMALVAAKHMGSRAQRYAFKPLGVAAVLGPFNFPLHLMHGHVVPALLTGNTVVVKPSEWAPGVGQLYAECFEAAGFPAGVFNLVQGEAASGAKLAAHADVDAVMLTGSYQAGQAIKRATLDQPHKLLALELGGRNPAIVLQDADLDKAVHDVLWGAYVTTGQRCSGTAVAMIERSLFDRFAARALEVIDRIMLGDPLRSDVFMGPLIHEAAAARFLSALDEAERSGVVALRKSRDMALMPRGAYVAPSLHHVTNKGTTAYETEELFGPDLALEVVDDLDEAIARANASIYGLSASVMTRDEARFEHAFTHLRYGCVNWNAPTCGASSRLPFGGTRRSGNHRPAALFSTLYCTYPVATLEGQLTLDRATLSPGFSI